MAANLSMTLWVGTIAANSPIVIFLDILIKVCLFDADAEVADWNDAPKAYLEKGTKIVIKRTNV